MFTKIVKKTKRRGQGYGSGKGHSCGYGQKGQKVRGRGKVARYNEGGNIALYKRIPKYRGSNNIRRNRKEVVIVRLDKLMSVVKDGDKVNKAYLVSKGFVKATDKYVKIVGNNASIKHKITVDNIAMSKAAKDFVEKAGGTVL